MIDRNFAIDDFAYRCFRDTADEDYMAARMAFHAGIEGTSTWLSHQAIEKWLKCILLLNRIPATTIGHDLQKAIELLDTFDIRLGLTERTQELISYLDQYGWDRYFVVSTVTHGANIAALDRASWELRRFCTRDKEPCAIKLRAGHVAKHYSLEGGLLEKVLENKDELPARSVLVRHNGFWGRPRRMVRVPGNLSFKNATLDLFPELIPELEKLVHIPHKLRAEYRAMAPSGSLTELSQTNGF